jgi:Na+/melibiose symporter-like transporter
MTFLLVYPTITVAVSTSGFHLVMSDMVLEMKRQHAKEGRMDEPSLAAIYLGMNTLFCKPAESFLPVLAANMLKDLNIHTEGDKRVQSVLYKVLVIPPLIFSVLEWSSWRRFTLTRRKTRQMREDLQGLPASDE